MRPLCGLLDDLVAIRTATVTLPTPPRVDDYQLTPDDAARLRPGGWRRLVAAIGSGRAAFTRPLAVGLTTLGLAGLLVATVPSVLTGTTPLGPTAGAASAPQANEGAEDSSTGGAAAGAGSAAGAPPAPNAAANQPRLRSRCSRRVPPRARRRSEPLRQRVGLWPHPVREPRAPVASAAPVAPAAAGPPRLRVTTPQRRRDPATTPICPRRNQRPERPPRRRRPRRPRRREGSGHGGDQGLAAPVANPLPTSQVPAPESQTLDEQRAADGGPSVLVLVSAALLVGGVGLLIVQRIGRRPIE